MVNVIVTSDTNVIEENFLFTGFDATARATTKFLDLCNDYISNWDEYDAEDIDTILDNGYEQFGNGYILISHPVLDPDIEQPLTIALNGDIIDSSTPYSC